MRVAIWPVNSCGHCYPCRIGRGNACVRISLTGIHCRRRAAGAARPPRLARLADRRPGCPALTALVEPVSIAVRAVARGRVAPGEHVVILGAGPIGQALALAASDLGASALLVDRIDEPARPTGTPSGPTPSTSRRKATSTAAVREWSGGDGPEVVFEATGVPGLVQTAVELVAQAGRVVVVGLSSEHAPVRVGDLPFREIDLIGTSCCGARRLRRSRRSRPPPTRCASSGLVTHEFTLEQAPEAIAYAIEHPAEVMKAVVRLDGP